MGRLSDVDLATFLLEVKASTNILVHKQLEFLFPHLYYFAQTCLRTNTMHKY